MKKIVMVLMLVLISACGDSKESWIVKQEEMFIDLYHDAFPKEKVMQAWRVSPRDGFPVKNNLGVFQYTGYGVDAVVRGKDDQCRLFQMTLACTEKTSCFKVRHGGSSIVSCNYQP